MRTLLRYEVVLVVKSGFDSAAALNSFEYGNKNCYIKILVAFSNLALMLTKILSGLKLIDINLIIHGNTG